MDSNIKLLLERAENELDLAKVIFTTTEDKSIQTEVFHLNKIQTFYSSVISHSYYCIFYSAKAYLLMKGIKTEAPEVHKKTFEACDIIRPLKVCPDRQILASLGGRRRIN